MKENIPTIETKKIPNLYFYHPLTVVVMLLLDWGGFIFGKGNIYSWWDKVCGISCDISKSPMLIMKENRCPIRVIMHRSEDIEICLRTSSVEIIKVRTYSRSTVIIFELSDFCNFVDYKAFEKCHT